MKPSTQSPQGFDLTIDSQSAAQITTISLPTSLNQQKEWKLFYAERNNRLPPTASTTPYKQHLGHPHSIPSTAKVIPLGNHMEQLHTHMKKLHPPTTGLLHSSKKRRRHPFPSQRSLISSKRFVIFVAKQVIRKLPAIRRDKRNTQSRLFVVCVDKWGTSHTSAPIITIHWSSLTHMFSRQCRLLL